MGEMSPPVRRSPLARRTAIEADGGAVRMAERPFTGKHILRTLPDEAVELLRAALGLGLPFDPLTSSSFGGASFLWMGPDEWMLVTDPEETATCVADARRTLAGTHHQLVDVGDYYTEIEIAGPKVRELLMKLTTVDLHPRAFTPGMVTGCILGRANAMIWLADGGDAEPLFRVFIRWSMAEYLWLLLADAGREWGVPGQDAVAGERLTVA